MALDVYFREDIRNILRATYVASEGSTALLNEVLKDPELQSVPLVKLLRVYKHGFAHALGAIGLAFGLDPMPAAPELEGEHSLVRFEAKPTQKESAATQSLSSGSRDSGLNDLDLGRFLWSKAQHERRR